ncbi:MAG TPA: riboflavin synthase [bacterium]|nr:riboflavin synthase [bacterium]
MVETVGRVEQALGHGSNRVFKIEAAFAGELKLGESVAVNGCCLTVTRADKQSFEVEAVATTLAATTLGRLKTGDEVNLERALQAGDRIGGHFVQGHVDEVGKVRRIERHSGYWTLAIETDRRAARPLVEKGSVCLDGISLTVASLRLGEFAVNIIPHTWENTNLKQRRPGDKVNIEYDLLVKAVRHNAGTGSKEWTSD